LLAALAWTPAAEAQRIAPGVGPGIRGPVKRSFPGPARKAAAQNLVDHLMSLSPDEQRDFMQHDRRFQRLPPRQQENIQRRIEEFNKLPAARREALRERYELFRQLPPERQDRARALYRQWSRQREDRRQEMRREFRHLREATPEERKLRMESDEYRDRFSEEERGLLQGLVDLLPEQG
jgi:hypothetical protein